MQFHCRIRLNRCQPFGAGQAFLAADIGVAPGTTTSDNPFTVIENPVILASLEAQHDFSFAGLPNGKRNPIPRQVR